MKTIRKHFDNITEFVEASHKVKGFQSGFGKASSEEHDKCLAGDDSYVSEAQAYLDKINDTLPETLRNEWHSDVFGSVISVPDYLSSCPVPFRRERVSESSYAPVKILCSLTSSGGLSDEVLRDRGIVIMALMMKIQQFRPVDLTVYAELDFNRYRGGSYVSLNIESRPLSIAHALNVLANANVARQMFYQIIKEESEKQGGHTRGGWPEGFTFGAKNIEYNKQVKSLFGMTDGDLFIPPTYLTDAIVNDPLGWINENLQKLVHFSE